MSSCSSSTSSLGQQAGQLLVVQALGQTGLVFADLPFNGGDGSIHGSIGVAGGGLAPIQCTAGIDGDLGLYHALLLIGKGDGGLGVRAEESVQLETFFSA